MCGLNRFLALRRYSEAKHRRRRRWFGHTSGCVSRFRCPLVWGQPALELGRMLAIKGYNIAFTLVSKLREGLVRGFNVGLMCGVVEMDGAHASGRRASEKRGRPLTFR